MIRLYRTHRISDIAGGIFDDLTFAPKHKPIVSLQSESAAFLNPGNTV